MREWAMYLSGERDGQAERIKYAKALRQDSLAHWKNSKEASMAVKQQAKRWEGEMVRDEVGVGKEAD